MAHVDDTNIILYLSKEEAECLRCFLEWCCKFGDDYDLDPKYEDWDWDKTKRTMLNIADVLPEAL